MTQRRRTMNRNQMGTGRIPASDHLKSDLDELVPDMVAVRRDLHKHPELAFEEVRTSGIVSQRLDSLGLQVQTGVAQTGVVGLLRGGKSSPSAPIWTPCPSTKRTSSTIAPPSRGKCMPAGTMGIPLSPSPWPLF